MQKSISVYYQNEPKEMKEPKIKRANNNRSKGKTYAALMHNYKVAIENGYYGEAELIAYAFIEDRLRSFLYYSGMLDTYNSVHINDCGIIIYGKDECVKNISAKINVIKKAFNSCGNSSLKNDFTKELRRNYRASLNIPEFRKKLNEIDKWCEYRNEIVHGMFNKDLEALRSGYQSHVEEGYKLGRYIDQQVQHLKEV